MKRVAFHTLGCKLNFSESSEIGRQLEEEGYQRVPFGSEAEVTVIHTCSVTGSADRKTRQALQKAKKTSPSGILVAMGCVAQLKPDEVASWNEVDLILGTHEKFNLPEYLRNYQKTGVAQVHACEISLTDEFDSAHSDTERTRAFLKVQDGCDYVCTYCTIPAARGKSRNPSIESLLEETQLIADKGVKEIVLTGVNIGDFGRSTGESFSDLIKALERQDAVFRFRISSIEPNLIDDELIHFIAGSKHFAHHLHLPLQAGSDKTLKAMKRRYLTGLFEERVLAIHQCLPNAGIGADVIVGFPGETDDDFQKAFDFIQSLPLSYLHVFTYSERPGTSAAEMPGKVPNRIRDERSKVLHELSEQKKLQFLDSQRGKKEIVIFENRNQKGLLTGFTGNYIQMELEGGDELIGEAKRIII